MVMEQVHFEVLEQVYALFEAVVQYHVDLSSFLRQLLEGAFMQSTLESLLSVPTQLQP